MTFKKKEEMDSKWKQIATRAVTDENFKYGLVKDPISVMSEFGINVPEGAKIKIDSEKTVDLLAPQDPGDELKEEITWWQWRLKTIREFGQDLNVVVVDATPETEEGI